jgi:hypothetical protein
MAFRILWQLVHPAAGMTLRLRAHSSAQRQVTLCTHHTKGIPTTTIAIILLVAQARHHRHPWQIIICGSYQELSRLGYQRR